MFSSQDQWNEKSLLEQQIPLLGWAQKRKEYISLLAKSVSWLKARKQFQDCIPETPTFILALDKKWPVCFVH